MINATCQYTPSLNCASLKPGPTCNMHFAIVSECFVGHFSPYQVIHLHEHPAAILWRPAVSCGFQNNQSWGMAKDITGCTGANNVTLPNGSVHTAGRVMLSNGRPAVCIVSFFIFIGHDWGMAKVGWSESITSSTIATVKFLPSDSQRQNESVIDHILLNKP